MNCQIFADNYFNKNIGRKETTLLEGLNWLLRHLKDGADAKWFHKKWEISTIKCVTYIEYLKIIIFSPLLLLSFLNCSHFLYITLLKAGLPSFFPETGEQRGKGGELEQKLAPISQFCLHSLGPWCSSFWHFPCWWKGKSF